MGSGGFANPITGGGGALVRPSIHSPNYAAGAAGWTINADGSAEFNNLTSRGSVTVGTAPTQVMMSPAGTVSGLPDLEFTTAHTVAGDAAEIVAVDISATNNTGLVLSSTSYTDTVTGANVRGVCQIAPNNSYMAIRRTADGLYGGGYVSAKDAAGEVGYATAGTAVTALTANATELAATGPVKSVVSGATETWHTLTLAGGWTGTLKYRLVPSPANCIQIQSTVMTPGTKTDGTTIGTLPVGYRPSQGFDLLGTANVTVAGGQTPHFNVGTNGVITCWGYGSASTAGIFGLIPTDF